MATIKRSVTVDADVLKELSAERRANLSATVSDGLQLVASLDAQQAAIDLFEAEHGPIEAEELAPYLEAVIRAQVAAAALRRPLAKRRYRAR